jgi:hypothetical protein
MAEVRVWRSQRNAQEIRENMFKTLNGREPDLVGNWSFADGTANDTSANAHVGRLVGSAKGLPAVLPSSETLVPWTRLVGSMTYSTGATPTNATVTVSSGGVELRRVIANTKGEYDMTLFTRANVVDVHASDPSGMSAFQPNTPVPPHALRRCNLTLKPVLHIAGKAIALDRRTPHAKLVVELVRPEGPDPSSASSSSAHASETGPDDGSEPASSGNSTANHVLRLDGMSGLVELPPQVFNHLDEATFEAWIKWEEFQDTRQYSAMETASKISVWRWSGGHQTPLFLCGMQPEI